MNINIKGTNMELTDAVRDYVLKRIGSIEKYIQDEAENSILDAEVGKTTHHHKSGPVFRAEFNLSLAGNAYRFRAVSEQEDLYAAIDDAKEVLEWEVLSFKKKKKTLFRRGSAVIKNMMKGITSFRRKK